MAEASSSGEITINIRAPQDTKVSVTVKPESTTVLQLKELVAAQTSVESDRQRLIYSGRVLQDSELLSAYNIKHENVVHMVKGAPKTSAPPPAAAQVPQNLAAGNTVANNPLAPLLNAQNAGYLAGINPFAGMGINPQDPNYVQNMMNSPEAQAQMSSALSNPAVIDSIIESNPQLRAMGPQVRQIMQSQQFRDMMSNPQAMQQMMQTARSMRNNPALASMLGGAPQGGATNDIFGGAFGGGNATQTQQPGQQPNPAAMGGFPGMFGMPAPSAEEMAQMQQLLGGFGGMPGGNVGSPPPIPAGFFNAPQPTDTRPPEERFEVQLGQMADMGFTNPAQNIRALQASGGRVDGAIEYILSGN